MAQQQYQRGRAEGAPARVGGAERGTLTWLVGLLAALAVIWFLYTAPMVMMPLAAALLIAVAVWPVCRAVRDAVPDRLGWLGAAAGLGVVLAVLALFGAGLVLAGGQLIRLGRSVLPAVNDLLARFGGQPIASPGDLSGQLDAYGSRLFDLIGITTATAMGILLVLFLLLLMLTEQGAWKSKLASISDRGRDNDWPRVATSVGQKFRAFFFTRLILGAMTAVLYVGWLALFGVDYLLLWGLLAVLLNFIPTIGSIIAGTAPVLFVLATRDLQMALIIAAGLLTIEQVMGNFVDPKIMGHRLSVSPLVVLFSLMFWSWLWGIPGALLAVPLTVLFTVIAAHFQPLKPIALLLTSKRHLGELEDYSDPA